MSKIVVFLTLFLFSLNVSAQIKIGLGGNKNNTNNGSNTSSDIDYNNPKEYTIADITVTGVQFLNSATMISMTGLRIGDKIKIPSETISNAIRKLWKPGLIGDVKINVSKIEGENVFLNIALKERPRLSRYEFKGIPKGQIQTLSDKIKLIRGRMINDAMIKNTQNTIQNYFAEKGFKNVSVKISQRLDTVSSANNWVYLLIDVDKKDKVKIHDIEFVGAEKIKKSTLLGRMKKTKIKNAFRIFTASKFIKTEYEKDKESIIKYYNKQGYRNALIESDSVYKYDDETVNIRLKIVEGKQFFYRKIKWTGNYVYNEKQLSEVLGIEKGDIYDPEDLDKRLSYNPAGSDISSLYQDDGYLFFNIQPIEIQVDEDSVDIEMRITEGEQANINKVIVNGNTLTSDHVILRELRTMPGQKFSRSNIIRTQQELAQLGYFDPEKISIKPEPNPAEGTVNIQYKLEEKSSNQFELSGGWGGFYGFIGTLGLTINNFSLRKIFKEWRPIPQGDGQKLAIRFQSNGPRYQNYSISFTEPWLGGKKPHSFSVALSHSVQSGGNFLGGSLGLGNTSSGITSGMEVSSATISFGRRLTFPDDRFTMINSISFNRYKLNNYAIIQGFNSGISNNFSLNTTISRNSIDNPTYPRTGSSITFAVNLTPPYSMFMNRNWEGLTPAQRYEFVEYHKWMFDNTWYLKLAGNLVLRASSHIGFLGTYTDKVGYSPFERFVLGGSGMTFNNVVLGLENIALRGYPDRTIVPVEYIDGVKTTNGGVAYNKFVMELRYPISLQPSATVFVVTFAEAGNNWSSVQDMNPFDLKRSVGLGARIFMPAFGMLGFDYAWGFDSYPGKTQKGVEGQFHFTIGQQIR